MPRIRQLSGDYRAKDFRRAVRGRLAYSGLTQKDLADKLGISCSYMSATLSHPDNMSVKRLRETIDFLKIPPGDVLKFLGYSENQIKEVSGA